jgi:hypothetical protein
MKNKKGFMVFGAVATFIVMALGIGLFTLYQNYTQLQKQVYFNSANQGSENPNIQKDLAQLQKDVKNITDRQDKDAKYENDYSLNNGIIGRTLKEMAEKYFIESNSAIVNGALRISLQDSFIFSFDIPASIYNQFNEVQYDISNKNGQHIFFDKIQGNRERLYLDVFYQALDQKDSPTACPDTYEKDIQLVAGILKKDVEKHELIIKESYPNWDKIDFCQYVTKQKKLASTYWTFIETPPTLLKPYLKSESETWFGYTFDTNRFIDENSSEGEKVTSHRQRYLIIFSDKYKSSSYIDYRFFQVGWQPPYANHEDRDLRTDKTEYARVEGILDTVIQSLADKTVVLPMCDYACGY